MVDSQTAEVIRKLYNACRLAVEALGNSEAARHIIQEIVEETEDVAPHLLDINEKCEGAVVIQNQTTRPACRAKKGQEAKDGAPGASPPGARQRDSVRNENPQPTASAVAVTVQPGATDRRCQWRDGFDVGVAALCAALMRQMREAERNAIEAVAMGLLHGTMGQQR